jgi:hypothetical protein
MMKLVSLSQKTDGHYVSRSRILQPQWQKGSQIEGIGANRVGRDRISVINLTMFPSFVLICKLLSYLQLLILSFLKAKHIVLGSICIVDIAFRGRDVQMETRSQVIYLRRSEGRNTRTQTISNANGDLPSAGTTGRAVQGV